MRYVAPSSASQQHDDNAPCDRRHASPLLAPLDPAALARHTRGMTTTQTTESPTTAVEVADALCVRGWARKWARYTTVTDEYGNVAHLTDTEECVCVAFEWAVPGGVIDTLRLCATRPVSHVVAVVEALALPPEC